jgi:LCP family protein required for cell wall assembly
MLALPVLVVLAGLLIAFSGRGGAFRAADPTIAFWLILLTLTLAIWWIAAIVDAWLDGRHTGRPALAVVVLLVLTIGGGSAFASVQLWRVRNAILEMTSVTGDPTLVDTTPTPTFGGIPPTPDAGSPGPSPTRPPDWVDPSDNPPDDPSPSISPGPTPSIDITKIDAQGDGFLNVLIVGTDQGLPGHVGARTDTLVVVSVNIASGDVLMFSFPRDLQDFPIYNGGSFSGKINTFAGTTKLYPDQFPEPGLRSLAYEVGFLLGIPIDYYASVNVDGFMAVVDAVGGSVTVCNDRPIADDHLQFYLSEGWHQLNAADALRYARSRHGQAGGDFARARRQQELLVAIKKEILQPQNLARLPDVIEALAGVVNTNYPADQIQGLIDLAQQVQDAPSQTWVFKNPQWADFMTRAETGGRQVLTPRLDRIGQLSVMLFGDKSLYYGQLPTPSPGELPGPDATPSPDSSTSPDVCIAQP